MVGGGRRDKAERHWDMENMFQHSFIRLRISDTVKVGGKINKSF